MHMHRKSLMPHSRYWIVSDNDALWTADPAVAVTVTLTLPVGVCCTVDDPPPHPVSCVAANPPSKQIVSIRILASRPNPISRRQPRRVTRKPKPTNSPALHMRSLDGRMPLPESLLPTPTSVAIVRTEVAVVLPEAGAGVAGLKVQVLNAGRPEQANDMGWLKPPTVVSVTVTVPLCPRTIVSEVGLNDRLKLGAAVMLCERTLDVEPA